MEMELAFVLTYFASIEGRRGKRHEGVEVPDQTGFNTVHVTAQDIARPLVKTKGVKMAVFYFATIKLIDRFRGRLLRRDLQ